MLPTPEAEDKALLMLFVLLLTEDLVDSTKYPDISSLVLIPSDMVGGGFDPDSSTSVRMALAVETPQLAVETLTLVVETPQEERVDALGHDPGN